MDTAQELDFDELNASMGEIEFDSSEFSEFPETDCEETRYIQPLKRRFRKDHEIFYENAKQLVKKIQIKKGEAFYCFLSGNFVFL